MHIMQCIAVCSLSAANSTQCYGHTCGHVVQLQDSSEKALTDILDAFSILEGPTFHMLGNHW